MSSPVRPPVHFPRETFSASITPETLNEENRTVDVVWFTGAPIPRIDWNTGQPYVMTFDPKGVSLDRLNNGGPVLNAHSDRDMSDQVGVIERAWFDGTNYLATMRFSKRPEVDGIWGDIRDRIVQNFSMGVFVQAKRDITQDGDAQKTVLVTKWEPYEISLVPVPANANTTTLSAEGHPPTKGKNNMDETTTITAVELERTRGLEIRKRVAAARLGNEFADKLVAEGATLEAAATAIFEEMAKADDAVQIIPHHRATVTRDQREGMAMRMGEALAVRYSGETPSEGARQWVGASLVEMARECLSAAGVRFNQRNTQEVVRLAIGSGMTTSDFPSLLTESGNRMLASAYRVSAAAIKRVARQTTVKDFRNKSVLRLSEAPELLEVGEHGEITRGSRVESKETYALKTFSRIMGLTRHAIINDDLSAFADHVAAWGQAAASLEGKLLTDKLVANPTMGDGIALFHADHGNLATTHSLTLDHLASARLMMRKLRGLDSVSILDIVPEIILVPPSLETTAEQLLASISPTNVDEVNVFSGKLLLVVEPRLEDYSATTWYLFANPAKAAVLEVAYLEGQGGGPQLSTRVGFDVDGMEFKCLHDVGVGAIGWRGAQRNVQ